MTTIPHIVFIDAPRKFKWAAADVDDQILLFSTRPQWDGAKWISEGEVLRTPYYLDNPINAYRAIIARYPQYETVTAFAIEGADADIREGTLTMRVVARNDVKIVAAAILFVLGVLAMVAASRYAFINYTNAGYAIVAVMVALAVYLGRDKYA